MSEDLAVPSFTLNTGAKMPAVGLGVWMGVPGENERAEEMCKKALKVGYRLLDTAVAYKNEEAVGRAVRASGLPREEVFITTKLPDSEHHDVKGSLDKSLAALGMDYVDLYLIHWPQAKDSNGNVLPPDVYPTLMDTWKQMEAVFESGKARAIGVCNLSPDKIDRIVKEGKVIPAVHQLELHPCLPQLADRKTCEAHGIVVTAYTSLGRPGYDVKDPVPSFFQEELFKSLAAKYKADVGQVLLSWAVQHKIVVIPKTESESRLQQNLTLLKLDPADVAQIDAFHKRDGMHRSLVAYHSSTEPYGVFGWSYEQLGWPMRKGGFVM
ncbi:aldo/keto reductase [Auriculariales sp. MPI-PUGE-AT-0066]|nr:aldo/keto reductase [Auriculariales sp. MPI-PUGE-AT-0066]